MSEVENVVYTWWDSNERQALTNPHIVSSINALRVCVGQSQRRGLNCFEKEQILILIWTLPLLWKSISTLDKEAVGRMSAVFHQCIITASWCGKNFLDSYFSHHDFPPLWSDCIYKRKYPCASYEILSGRLSFFGRTILGFYRGLESSSLLIHYKTQNIRITSTIKVNICPCSYSLHTCTGPLCVPLCGPKE